MDVVSDLHLHSRYSRAVSQEMNLLTMSNYAKKKGLEILATGDWIHPMWFREIKSQLEEAKQGLFQIKDQKSHLKNADKKSEMEKEVYFLLSVEISCIFSQGGKSHRMHNLVLSPSFATSEKITKELIRRGCNVSSDGRPIIGLTAKQLLQLMLEIDEEAMLIPCHIWTPWFSLYGANSGFDRLEDCFEDLSPYIYGIETGLSSDPEMNWSVKDMDNRSILSFSDAHSPAKMGREATVFRLEDMSFENIRKAIMEPSQRLASSGERLVSNKVLYTVEFYPEEGKYHYNGHRNCKVYQTPEETRKLGEICPVCHRRITVGVMQRVQDLSSREVHGIVQENKVGLRWIKDPTGKHPPFVKLVPLNEIIAEALGFTVASGKVKTMFDELCDYFGSEMTVLLKTSVVDIEKKAGERIAEGVAKVREGNIVIHPGYDNVYGTVRIWNKDEGTDGAKEAKGSEKVGEDVKDQLGIDF